MKSHQELDYLKHASMSAPYATSTSCLDTVAVDASSECSVDEVGREKASKEKWNHGQSRNCYSWLSAWRNVSQRVTECRSQRINPKLMINRHDGIRLKVRLELTRQNAFVKLNAYDRRLTMRLSDLKHTAEDLTMLLSDLKHRTQEWQNAAFVRL